MGAPRPLRHPQTVVVPTASIDDMQSTEPPRKRLRRLRRVESDDRVTIPLAAAQSASLPKSVGTRKTLLERFPDLKFVIREWNQWHEQERAIDNDVNFDNVRDTFDQILKQTDDW